MFVIWGTLAGLLFYLETVYHFGVFGLSSWNPIYTITLIMAWSGAATLIIGVLRGRGKKIFYYCALWLAILWVCVQYVYYSIFRQPLLWEALFRGGQDALTNYWREALTGIVQAIPVLLLMILPGVVIGIVMHCSRWEFPVFGQLQFLRNAVILVLGIAGEIVTLLVGKTMEADYYESYREFYDPLSVAQEMGYLPMLQRDTIDGPLQLAENLLGDYAFEDQVVQVTSEESIVDESEEAGTEADNITVEAGNDGVEAAEGEGSTTDREGGADGENGAEPGESGSEEQPREIIPRQFDIDYEKLHALADNSHQTWLADYIQGLEPVTTNEYTGLFAGYNLIFLTAEGFSSYAIREDLTPTLYRLVNSGFVFENYYVPLWQTSTSDGEYINCTGLIPDGQFSMRESGDNNMAYGLPGFFATEGVESYAYHNNSLSYYDRHISHPNLGYNFKGAKLGELSKEEWGAQIFPMEHPNAWPASDLEMMQGTAPEYLQKDRFHVYYLTVSGHMNYNFKGNAMSYKNREAVAGLELSENARAYLACQMELDKALENLLVQLEATGQLEKTVICLSADHYPYGMTLEQCEELAGKPLSEGMDLYRNSLILWNAEMEEEPVYVKKACGSMDLLPTLLNLFGFSYDSRMYAGRDIFSQGEGLVIFNDRSFVTDSVIYKRKGKETTWLTDENGVDVIGEEEKETYLSNLKQEVKDRYQFSAYILQEDYYTDVQQAVITAEVTE